MQVDQYPPAERAEGDRAVLKAQRREHEVLFAEEIGQDALEFVMNAG
jgi:hypothetical protein